MLYSKSWFKSFVLFILVLLSFAQVGILWYDQSHSFPFVFVDVFGSRIIEDKTEVIEKARSEVYKPYRLTISNGSASHWLIGENDEIKQMLFKEINGYLKEILKSSEGAALDINLWPELVIKSSILVEFKTGIKTDLLNWFLNNRKSSKTEFDSIQKILMVPNENINNNNTIYLLTSKGLYKYIMPFNKNGISRRNYIQIINDFESMTNIPKYNVLKEIDPNNIISSSRSFSIPKDTFCMVQLGSSYLKLPSIKYKVASNTADIDEVAAAILGNEKESYDRYIESNALVFKNINNIYRLYNDGLLEYKYVPGGEGDQKGDIGEAFENAYFFINRVKDSFIHSDSELYLKKIKESNPNYYEFVFDYKIGDHPVYISFDEKGNDKQPLVNALTIKVNSKRIIECRWYIINIQESRTYKEYNVYFQGLLDSLTRKYGKKALENYDIKDTTIAYLINDNEFNIFLPVWIAENPDEEYYYVELNEKPR